MIPLSFTVIVLAMSGPPQTSLHERISCNASSNAAQNCLDEFRNAARHMFNQDNEAERAQTAGEAMRNCWTCAGETLNDELNNFRGSDSGTNSDDSQ